MKLVEIFGVRLKYWRKKRGLTQKQLADKLGKTNTLIAHYESGRRPPTLYTVEEFLDALNVNIAEFFEEES